MTGSGRQRSNNDDLTERAEEESRPIGLLDVLLRVILITG